MRARVLIPTLAVFLCCLVGWKLDDSTTGEMLPSDSPQFYCWLATHGYVPRDTSCQGPVVQPSP